MAGHARTGQGQAGPDRAGFDRTLQDRVDQGRTGENSQTDIPTIHTYIDTYIQTDRQTGDLTASTYTWQTGNTYLTAGGQSTR